MPDDDYDDDQHEDEQDDDRKVTLSRQQIRALEKRPKTEDFTRLQRENVLLKLGIDTDSPAGKMLLGNSELEWDKPDTIKTMATEAGLIKTVAAPAEEEGQEADSEELNQGTERSGLSQGAASDDGKPRTDPRKSASDEAAEALRRGAKEEEGVGHFIHRMAEAAQAGDQRVVVR